MISQHLQDMVDAEAIPEWVALRLDRLGSEALKEQAAGQLKSTLSEALDALCDRLEHPEGKMLYQAAHSPASSPKRLPAVAQKLERYISWDLVVELENWLADEVPPYRWVRRGFSLACSYFSVQKVFAVLVSGALLYGGYRLVSSGVKWGINHMMRHEQSTKENNGLPMAPPAAVPVPRITSGTYKAGNKLQLTWDSLGEGYTYRVFRNCYPDETNYQPRPVVPRDVSTSGALVNLQFDNDCRAPVVQVMAFSPGGVPGELSAPVTFRLSLVNQEDTVEPLATEAQAAADQKGGQPEKRLTKAVASGRPVRSAEVPVNRPTGQPPLAPASHSPAPTQPSRLSVFAHALLKNTDGVLASAIPMAPVSEGVVAVKNAAVSAHDEGATAVTLPPAPKNLRGQRIGNTLRMTWDTPGTEYRYNVYVAYATDHPVFDTGNDTPLNGPVITWTPPAEGTQVFNLYIKAVDAQGREGPASNRIVADLR